MSSTHEESPNAEVSAESARDMSQVDRGVDDPEEEDDDDMDYEPANEDSGDDDFFDSIEGMEDESGISDGSEGMSQVEIEIPVDNDESEESQEHMDDSAEEPLPRTRAGARSVRAQIQVPRQILEVLGGARLGQFLINPLLRVAADDDDEDEYLGSGRRRRRGAQGDLANKFPPIPSEEGRRLMDTNVFGMSDYYRDVRRKRSKKLARKLMSRELGVGGGYSCVPTSAITQDMLPSTTADTIIHYNTRCYSGQFSDDGNFYFSCAQDFKVRMYDTSNPYHWKYYKTVDYPFGQWTITDASLSPDNKYLAYSSIKSIVCLALTDPNEKGEPWVLDFSNTSGRRGGRHGNSHHSHFGIWSLRFSGDGREIVAGTSDHSVYVYDIEKRQSILRIPGHSDHVNAVCFGDTSSPHVLYSGSDDTLIKVWDRRSMGDSREAGVFMGHTEGLTYVDSKGDGRYVLSNGKDQTMKLWDLRKMMSTEKASTIDPARYSTAFDYRFMTFSAEDWRPHPHDCSLVTYRGHRVLKTLIRCHFSPPDSTNSRYVYSGSEDGSVYIYNIDATLAGKIDVNKATHHSRPRDPEIEAHAYGLDGNRGSWKTCVRDVSWHPHAPVIAATSWNGWGMSTGTCTTHSWNDGAEEDEGIPRMGLRVNPKLQQDERLYGGLRMGPQTRFVSENPRQYNLRSRGTAGEGEADIEEDEEEEQESSGTGGWW